MSPPHAQSRPTAGPYPVAAALAAVSLCSVDIWAISAPLDARFLLYLPLLAAPLGALAGGGLGLMLDLLPRVPRVGPALLPTLGVASGLHVARALGVFERLQGPRAGIAWATLAACAAGGGALSLGLWLFQRRAAGAEVRARALRPPARYSLAALLLAGAAGLTWADHVFYVRLYPAGHLALRMAALQTATWGLVTLLRWPRTPALGWLGLCLAFAAPVATLHQDDTATIQAFITRPWPGLVLRISRALFDVDRDGFSPVLGGGDCDNLDPHIHPAAREIPGNGIDDNCMFGDAQEAIVDTDEVPRAVLPASTSVVLITVDTLRWDRFGLDDPAHAETMPQLMAWARKATTFRRAYSPGGWTSIALAALLHGRYARKLRWESWYEYKDFHLYRTLTPAKGEKRRGKPLKMFPIAFRDPHQPLPFWLRRRGMHTAAVVDDGFSQMLARSVGTATGFNVFREVSPRQRSNQRVVDTATTGVATRVLESMQRRAPFFLWVHYFGPHTPNTRHEGVRIDGNTQPQRYDHEVRHLDRELGKLLGVIDALQLPVAVFVTADHGEAFGKGYRSHGMDLRESLIRIPLVAHVPGWPAGVRDELVSLIDLAPTILSLTDTPAPAGLDGIDLDPVVRGVKRIPDRIVFSDNWLYRPGGEAYTDMVAAYDGERKVVFDRRAHGYTFEDQRSQTGRGLPIEGGAPGRLVRAALAYVEDSGGSLRIDTDDDTAASGPGASGARNPDARVPHVPDSAARRRDAQK